MKLQQWLLFHLCRWILPALYSHFFHGQYLPIPVLEVRSSNAELNCRGMKPVSRDIPQLSAISNLPYTRWTRSAPPPLCFFYLSIKDLRHLFHRNTTAAYLRGVLPCFSLEELHQRYPGASFLQASLSVWHDLRFSYIPDYFYKELETIKSQLLSPRNLRPCNLPS